VHAHAAAIAPSIITGSFAVGGAILGAVLTFIFAKVTGNAQRATELEKEDRAWDREREKEHRTAARDAEVQMLNEANRFFNAVIQDREIRDDSGMYMAWAALPLTTSAEVRDAGGLLAASLIVWSQQFVASQKTPALVAVAMDSNAKYHEARNNFIAAVRRDRRLPELPPLEDAVGAPPVEPPTTPISPSGD
jgi:hypothetical protein